MSALERHAFRLQCAVAMLLSASVSMMTVMVPLYATSLGLGPQWLGLLVALPGLFPVLLALPAGRWVDRFGPARVRDTPICEALLAGMAVGAAASGRRPILHLMYGNFLYTAFDAIANQAAKLHYMTGGQMRLPLVFMAVYGAGRSIGAQHSDVPYPALMNLGGLKVVVPATPADAKGPK